MTPRFSLHSAASTPDSRLLIDIKALATLLDVSVRHLERMEASAAIPKPLRLGKAKRWRVNEIISWLEAESPDRKSWEAMQGGVR